MFVVATSMLLASFFSTSASFNSIYLTWIEVEAFNDSFVTVNALSGYGSIEQLIVIVIRYEILDFGCFDPTKYLNLNVVDAYGALASASGEWRLCFDKTLDTTVLAENSNYTVNVSVGFGVSDIGCEQAVNTYVTLFCTTACDNTNLYRPWFQLFVANYVNVSRDNELDHAIDIYENMKFLMDVVIYALPSAGYDANILLIGNSYQSERFPGVWLRTNNDDKTSLWLSFSNDKERRNKIVVVPDVPDVPGIDFVRVTYRLAIDVTASSLNVRVNGSTVYSNSRFPSHPLLNDLSVYAGSESYTAANASILNLTIYAQCHVNGTNTATAFDLSSYSTVIVISGIVFILCVLSLFALYHNKVGFKCVPRTDDAKITYLFTFGLQVWDFLSDANFTLELNQHRDDSRQLKNLYYGSVIFLSLPWLLNLIWLLQQRTKWIKHTIVNAWVREFAWFLLLLTMISGGANPAIKLCNSRILGLNLFSMQLPKYEYLQQSRWPIMLSVWFENIPQIIIQWYYLSIDLANKATTAAYFSLISSITAVVFALLVLILRCSDPFDDCQFAIHLHLLRELTEEDEHKLKSQLGQRKKIALAIAGILEINASMVDIDRITRGYQKVIVYVSITGASHLASSKKPTNKREAEELRDELIDQVLNVMTTARNDGRFADMFKHVLQLNQLPVVEKIADIDITDHDDTMEKLQSMAQAKSKREIRISVAKENSPVQLEMEIHDKVAPSRLQGVPGLPSAPSLPDAPAVNNNLERVRSDTPGAAPVFNNELDESDSSSSSSLIMGQGETLGVIAAEDIDLSEDGDSGGEAMPAQVVAVASHEINGRPRASTLGVAEGEISESESESESTQFADYS